MKLTKYGRKLKLKYFKWTMIACAAFAVSFPFFDGMSKTKEGYYEVVLNGENLGAVNDEDIVNEAYLEARRMIERDNDASVYIDYELEIKKEDKMYGEKISKEELTDKMYESLSNSSVEVKEKAYVVNIDDFKVTLGSKEEVMNLLNAAKKKYDTEDKFTTVLTDSTDSRYSYMTYEFVDFVKEETDIPQVMASEDGVVEDTVESEVKEDGIVDIGFKENVEIIETYVSKNQIDAYEEAVEMVTKEKEESKIYVVVEGDTLSGIAKSYGFTLAELLAMNPDFTEEGYINIGDRLVVTVPEPELSVVVTEQKSYEEAYNLPVEYVYNDSKYTTYSKVVNQGTEGYRAVVADVVYENGTETSRKIIKEEVITPATAKVVEVGTLTPPTFIKPISGGYLTSTFGPRWGSFHSAVDWGCGIGTSVMASCSGTVVQAGWNGGYGYCITISHGNGMKTRYAHLSKILVSNGERVNQGEVIAYSGNTGNSTGPHLHFEVIENGVKVNPFSYIE